MINVVHFGFFNLRSGLVYVKHSSQDLRKYNMYSAIKVGDHSLMNPNERS
jgi:hypothetical protein